MILNGIHLTKIDISPYLRQLLFLLMGILRGFTTYSTFGFESLALLKDGEFFKTSANILIHLLVGLSAVWIGDTLDRL